MSRYLIILTSLFLWHTVSAKKLPEKPLRISIIYESNALRLPGESLVIGVEALMPDSTVLKTRNIGGNLGLTNFEFELNNGSYQFGKIHFPESTSNAFSISVHCKKYPEVASIEYFQLHHEDALILKLPEDESFSPGVNIPIELEAIVRNDYDKEFIISPSLNQYEFAVSGGTFKNGRIKIAQDPRDIQNHEVELYVQPITRSMETQIFTLIMDYRRSYKFRDDGFFGSNGSSGFSGTSGIHGQHGQDGQHGDQGPNIDVYIEAHNDSILQTVLLDVEVSSQNKKEFYRINPDGGFLQIISEGGDGGNGGNGGDGGNGMDGHDGAVYKRQIATSDSTWTEIQKKGPGGNGQNGGDGGHGGWGGDGGPGGMITVYYNALAEHYLNTIQAISIGGDAGNGASGGAGGRGGKGGDGNPNGTNGQAGYNGAPGRNGYHGNQGEVRFILIE
ncbi:hypothetical protein [Marinoscillum pacificum]|uniref:hypothetical protein n=1 Tax=Marinoscillum pacificum TaxID=392723 RepID=UPI00280B3765|nr:hypothetical protein [Marinoscillum pacificum]